MPAYPMNEEPTSLPVGGVRTLIRDLGGEEDPGHPPYPYTGALRLQAGERKNASLWVYEGVLYAAHLQGYDPPVALRLKTARFISEQQYQELLSLPSSDAGPEAVDRNWVPAYVVEELHREIMLATLSHLYDWNDAQWWWEEDETTNLFVTSGLPLMLASSAVDERIGQWKAVTRAYPSIVKPKSIPHPGPVWSKRHHTMLSPELESVLALVNGTYSISEIAGACGLTRFEMAKLLSQATAFGIVSFAAGDSIASAPAPSPDTRHPDELHSTQNADFATSEPAVPHPSALASAPPPTARRARSQVHHDAVPAPQPSPDYHATDSPDEHLAQPAGESPIDLRKPPRLARPAFDEDADEGSRDSAPMHSAQPGAPQQPDNSAEIQILTEELDSILTRVAEIRQRIDGLDS